MTAPSGPLRDWLAVRREALNARFRAARRRFPRLDGDAVLALCRELLPPLAGDEPDAPALLDAVFDLVLLHAGRGYLAPSDAGGDGRPGLRRLLADALPALRPLLLLGPRQLPGALSNAVENLGPRGPAFAARVAALAPHLAAADELLDAGAVVAWRLGDARLRDAALGAAARLSPRAALDALGLPWPDEAVPFVRVALAADGWTAPEALLTPTTLAGLAAAPERWAEMAGRLPAPAGTGWRETMRVGEFVGFGGDFEEPPRLLDGGGRETPHRFWARCGAAAYRLDADAFGWVCRPDAAAAGWRPREARRGPHMRGASSTLELPGLVVWTRPDSFRVRVLTPPREAL